MKPLSQLAVIVFDLVEAQRRDLITAVRVEARRAQATALHLAMGILWLALSMPLFLAGFGLLATGFLWWLEPQVGRPLAASITGIVMLVLGGGCLSLSKSLAGRQVP